MHPDPYTAYAEQESPRRRVVGELKSTERTVFYPKEKKKMKKERKKKMKKIIHAQQRAGVTRL